MPDLPGQAEDSSSEMPNQPRQATDSSSKKNAFKRNLTFSLI
jgi:hypothetical protein